MVVPHGVDFEAPRWSTISFILHDCGSRRRADTHVEVLSQLAMMVIDPDFKEALIKLLL